jgi:hypothetical protein
MRRSESEPLPKSGRLIRVSSDISRTSPTVFRSAARRAFWILVENRTRSIGISSGNSGVGATIGPAAASLPMRSSRSRSRFSWNAFRADSWSAMASCASCPPERSFSLRLHTQPRGFFFGVCRAPRMLTGEPFNPTFFGMAGISSKPSSPSLLEASLQVKRNNAHGWSSRSGSPQNLQRVPMA